MTSKHTIPRSILHRILSCMVHEIKNPLSNIHLQIQLLKKKIQGISDGDRIDIVNHFGILEQEIERLSRLLDDYQRYSKSPSLEMTLTDPIQLLKSTVDVIQIIAKENAIQIKLDYEDDIPPILCDAMKIQQVFMNLLQNSFNAMEKSGGCISVNVRRVTGDMDCVLFIFSDAGPGIAEKDREWIFSPFYSSRVDGTGLGLFIVKRIIEAHGGDVFLAGSSSEGSSFHVIIPLIRQDVLSGNHSDHAI